MYRTRSAGVVFGLRSAVWIFNRRLELSQQTADCRPQMARAVLVVLAVGLAIGLDAQSPAPPSVADYGQWETLLAQQRGGLSPDGRWIAYGINRSNRNNELRIASIAGGPAKVAAFGLQPQFSADS